MDVARLVLEYLQALIWPAITMTAILLFRQQLRQVLANIGAAVHRVTKLTAAGGTVDLVNDLSQKVNQMQDVEQVKEDEKELSSEVPEKGLGHGTGTWVNVPESKSLDDQTRDTILRIWLEIDKALESTARRLFPSFMDSPKRPVQIIRMLRDEGLITEESADSLLSARRIRNQLVTGTETIPLSAFDDYLRNINKLKAYVKFVDQLV